MTSNFLVRIHAFREKLQATIILGKFVNKP